MDREKKAGAAGYPTPAITAKRATGNEAMDVRMMGEGLPPCVKNGDETKFTTLCCLRVFFGVANNSPRNRSGYLADKHRIFFIAYDN